MFHVKLPSGAIAKVSPDVDAKTLEALDQMMVAATRPLTVHCVRCQVSIAGAPWPTLTAAYW